MAIKTLNFTKSWLSALDFPTFEEDEQQVRRDFEELHKQTKEYINLSMIPDIIAGNVPFAPIEGVNAQNVQEAVGLLQTAITEIAADPRFIPDASIGSEKLKTDLTIDGGTY